MALWLSEFNMNMFLVVVLVLSFFAALLAVITFLTSKEREAAIAPLWYSIGGLAMAIIYELSSSI